MQPSIERPLKFLNAELAARLASFNGTQRALRQLGIPVLEIDFAQSKLVVGPTDGHRLYEHFEMTGFSHMASAGSTRYRIVVDGTTIEWREPISYARPAEWRLH